MRRKQKERKRERRDLVGKKEWKVGGNKVSNSLIKKKSM